MQKYLRSFLQSMIVILTFSSGYAAEYVTHSEELKAWSTTYFEGWMAKNHVPGAVLVVIQNGKPVVLRGFGVTTPENGVPVDPRKTLFRVGSITKVMTAIVALQLIDEGIIDLNTDVNKYLTGIQVPNKFGKSVTVHDLLVHKGGFGSELRGAEVPWDKDATLSSDAAQRLLASRVRPPGLYPAYDNNGWGVLGMVIADAADTDFRDLVRQRIFEPLGMTSAIIGLPDERRIDAAVPHNVGPSGEVWPIDYSLLTTIEQGAGNASMTGADMMRFMTALLQGGQLGGRRILSEAAFQTLVDFDLNRIHPAMPGYGRAVYEYRPHGRNAIRHDGGISGFVSSMVLYPESNVGVFYSFNAQPSNPFSGDDLSSTISGILAYIKSGAEIEAQVSEYMKIYDFHPQFAEKYIPESNGPDAADVSPRRSPEELRELQGTYRPTRAEYGTFIGNLKARLMGGQSVSLNKDGTLKIGADTYIQNDLGVFHKEGDDEFLAFAVDKKGVFMGTSSLFISKKNAWYETPVLTVLPLIIFPILLLSGLLYWRSYSKSRRQAAYIASGAGAMFVVGLVLEAEYANRLLVAGNTVPIFLWRLLLLGATIGLVVAALRAGSLVFTDIKSGCQGFMAACKTFHLALVALAAGGLVLLTFYWNLAFLFL